MNKTEAREKYKEIFGKNAPGFMKLEVLMKKIGIEQEIKKEENKMVTIDNLMNEPIKPIVPDTKVRKMTTKQYNVLKKQGKI